MTLKRNPVTFIIFLPLPSLIPEKLLTYFLGLYVVVRDAWLHSQSTMFSRCIHVVACTDIFYCWNILCCMDIPYFIYPLIDWRTFGLFLPFDHYEYHCPPWSSVYKPLCEHVLSFLLGAYLEVVFLGHVGTLCWTFWGSARLFSQVAAPFSFPPAVWDSYSLSTFSVTLIMTFLILAIFRCVQCYLTVVFIYRPWWLMTLSFFSTLLFLMGFGKESK